MLIHLLLIQHNRANAQLRSAISERLTSPYDSQKIGTLRSLWKAPVRALDAFVSYHGLEHGIDKLLYLKQDYDGHDFQNRVAQADSGFKEIRAAARHAIE